MTPKKTFNPLWILWAFLGIIVLAFLAFFLSPETLPENEGQQLSQEAAPFEVVVIYNPGGWGNATLAQSADFSPVLNGMLQTLTDLGYSSTAIAYSRTPEGLPGRITDVKELINSFKNSSRVQAKDLEYLMKSFPEKQFILTGFSNGGGLTEKTMEILAGRPRVNALVAGVPCWYQTRSSANFLVLNNSGRDSLSSCDKKTILVSIFEAPFRWLWAKITGRDLSLALAFEFPGHAYPWSSPEVSPPVIQFLESHFPAKSVK